MKTVALDQVMSGMTLSADALDRSGRLLVTSGTEITDKQIRLMRMWGVTHIKVECQAEEESSSLQATTSVEVGETDVKDLFRHTDKEFPPVSYLMTLCLKRRKA